MALRTRTFIPGGLVGLASSGAWPEAVRAYAVALVACVAALAVSFLVVPTYADDSIGALFFLAAVGLAGWYGGFGPALMATAFGALAIDYFFEIPRGTLQITSGHTLSDLLSFLIVASLLGSLNARLRLSNSRLREERDRARAALVARDDLMATVSHELRTPLTTIKTSVYSLRDRVRQLPDDTRDKLLSNIETEADRLAHFVSGALALRRLEHGVNPRWEWSAPGEVAWAVLDRCLPVLGGRPVHFAVADDLPPVRIDAGLLDQALSVLLENVAVHTPPGTAVTVEGGIVGRDLRLSVSDAGPGVPAHSRQRIFDKYERLTETSPGVGLGLAIARAAAEAQGGRLWVEDSPQGGAQFVLVIPNALDDRVAA
jgi:two-component system, OmpR family, sensor histidine kinase KdpD